MPLDLVGYSGRVSAEEITLLKNISGAHQDVFTTAILKQTTGL